MSTSRSRRTLAILATVALGSALAVGGCSSSGGGETAQPGTTSPLAPEDSAADSRAGQPEDGQQAPQATDTQKVVRTASLLIAVTSIDPAATAVRGVAATLGGQVTGENINAASRTATPGGASTTVLPPSTGSAGTISLDVPADRLDAALDQLAAIGRVVQRTSNARDVTSTYVDTESRIATKKTSIERVRALLSQAAGLSQVVELESQLAQREAELESLQATLATLQKKIVMSTVTVTLTTDPGAGEQASGFMAGLQAGWQAFLRSLAFCLAAIGAALPFLGALATLGLPLLLWWRRREPVPSPAAAAPQEPQAQPERE